MRQRRRTALLALALAVAAVACGAPAEQDLTVDQERAVERLRSLGYLGGVTAGPPGRGVVVHDPERAYEGLNLYNAGHAPEATLIDMDGNLLHEWWFAYEDAFPGDSDDETLELPNSAHWRRVHVYPNGDLLAIFEGRALIKIDKDSRLLWAVANRAHHDVAVADNGNIYVLTRIAHLDPEVNPDQPILEDFITVLDDDGNELRRLSILDALRESDFADLLRRSPMRGDIMHTNTLQLLDADAEAEAPAFRPGNILISFRKLDAIAVIDPRINRVVWALRSLTKGQHDPTLLDDGNVLIFDNQRAADPGSRVVEVDPVSREIQWRYPTQDMDAGLYSRCCGTAQRLPNGNTLITYTGPGRAVEVTPRGRTVWEFENPHSIDVDDGTMTELMEDDDLIAQLMEVRRLPPEFGAEWLDY